MTCRPFRALPLLVAAAVAGVGAPAVAPAAEPPMAVKDYVVPIYTPAVYRGFYATGMSARDVTYVGLGAGWMWSGRSPWSFELGGRLGVSDRPALSFGSLQVGAGLGPGLRLFGSRYGGARVFARVNGDLATNVWGAEGTSHRADVTAGVRLWAHVAGFMILGDGAMAFPIDYADQGERALRFGVLVNAPTPGEEDRKPGRILVGAYWVERFDANVVPGQNDGSLLQVSVALLR